jgi:hypothetical protein
VQGKEECKKQKKVSGCKTKEQQEQESKNNKLRWTRRKGGGGNEHTGLDNDQREGRKYEIGS